MPFLLWSFIIAAANGSLRADEPTGQKTQAVRAQDIPEKVTIIGKLGHPLGSLLTLRGSWVHPGIRAKDASPLFHVTHVNGEKLAESVEFHGLQVGPILPHHKGRKLEPGDPWDWRFGWHGTEPFPTSAEGDTWEMMAVETGVFETYSADAWQQIGPPIEQSPGFKQGFYTYVKYIAVRRVR